MKLIKKLTCVLTALCLLFPSLTPVVEAASNPPIAFDVNGDEQADFEIRVQGWPAAANLRTEQKTYQNAVYTSYIYEHPQQPGVTFTFTVMKTSHQDVLFFAEQSQAPLPEKTILTIQVNESVGKHQYLQPQDRETFLGEWLAWEPESSTATLPLRPVYLQGEKLYARIGTVDLFSPQGYTVKTLENTLPATMSREDGRTLYKLELPGDANAFSETWGILTGRPLVNWDLPYAANAAKKMDIDTFRKLSADGLYDVTPLSYTPSSNRSYYRNPANITGLHMIDDINQPQFGSLAQIILPHLAYTSVRHQNAQGYWPTYPQSNWLFHDYGIGYQYFDNRRNADNATFLLRMNRRLPDPVFAETLKRWETFLFTYIDRTSLVTPNQGYLLSDYTDESLSRVSHTALNHHAAVLNYLLESNLYEPNEQKQRYIGYLLRGIEDTKKYWVKADSNLYYGLYRDYRPHPYPDYYSLTLEDLLLTRSLLRQNHMPESDAVNHLIEAKKAWIEAQRLLRTG